MSRSIRAALVSDAIFPFHTGGKEMRFHEMVRQLTATGVQVSVYTMKWWSGPSRISHDGVELRAVSPRLPLYRGARRSITQSLVFALACSRLLFARFDVLDADQIPYLQLFVLRVVTWLRRRPLVVTWHEVWGGEYWRTYLGRLGAVAAALELLAMRLPDHIVAASAETGRRVSAMTNGQVRVTVIPNGVNLALAAQTAPAAERSDVLFIGRLIEHKGAHLLVEATARMAERGRRLSCLIVGDGPERERLQALARSLGVSDLVSFLPFAPTQADVFALMKAARVVALPSVREGFGMVVAEAIACGTQVVTTDHRDNLARLLVQPGQGLVCTPTAEGLAAALESLLLQSPTGTAPPTPRRADGWGDRAVELTRVYESCAAR